VWKKNQRASQCGKPLKQASQLNFRCENRPHHARTTFYSWTRSPYSLSTPARAHFLLSTLARSLSTPAGAQSWLPTPTIGQSVMKNPPKRWNSTDFRQLAVKNVRIRRAQTRVADRRDHEPRLAPSGYEHSRSACERRFGTSE
jgi:hypothetical protein